MDKEQLEKFREACRQELLDPTNYQACLEIISPATAAREKTLATAVRDNSTDFANLARVAGDVAEDKFFIFSLHYTAGESLDKLRNGLEQVVVAYERYAKYDRQYRDEPRMPLFDFKHIDDYVRVIALLSLTILFRREDLIPRIHDFVSGSAFDEQDALYEELLTRYLPNRRYLDEWYHDLPYRYLLDVTAGESPKERTTDMQSYLKNWYKNMKGCGWYDSHKGQSPEGGGYFGYWAWEAGAVAYLYELDDTPYRDHLVYPKDLVDYARSHQTETKSVGLAHGRLRALPSEIVPQTGWWHTPALKGAQGLRYFEQGQRFPETRTTDYGGVIWNYDPDQQKDPPTER